MHCYEYHWSASTEKFTDIIERDHVIGCRHHDLNCWVLEDIIRDVQTQLYEHHGRLYPGSVPAHIDVTLDITDLTPVSVNGLLHYGL